MNAKIEDLMVNSVITTVPNKSIGHVRKIMETNNIQSVPVVNPDDEVVGIVTSQDLIADHNEGTPIQKLMTKNVLTVPLYSDVHIAARVMRNHKIHHLVVTHEKKIVGILSSFDLLKLVEDKRFVMKNPPTPSKKKSKRG